MQEHGHDWRLPSGAKVFVYPQDADAVMAAISREELRAHHVIAAHAFEPLVMEAVGRLPSRRRVDRRGVESMAYIGDGGEAMCVERTFLQISIHQRRSPESVTQSTTEAHGSENPRRPVP